MMATLAGSGMALVMLATASAAYAAEFPWRAGSVMDIGGEPVAGVFHHLESSGRRSIAADGRVVVAWEDNRSGSPQVYMALRQPGAKAFGKPRRLSDGKEAYEIAVTVMPDGRVYGGWEQDGIAVVARVDTGKVSPVRLPGANGSGQVSLDRDADGNLHAVWSAAGETGRRVMYANLGNLQQEITARVVEPDKKNYDQLYPAIAVTHKGVFVAWEDRRAGHTRIRYTRAAPAGRFVASRPLNDIPPSRSDVYGKGTGASRVALAGLSNGGVAAVWADKRDFRSGYDVYGSLIHPDGTTGPNEQVQDEFGATISQWHPAVAGGDQPVVAWDDDRDGSPDVLVSARSPSGWSDDLAVPGASGPGIQGDPALALDRDGTLHLAWIHRDQEGGPSRLRYLQWTPLNPPR